MSKHMELEELYARMDDLSARADRGELGVSDFLTPVELHYAEKHLRKSRGAFVCFGGYADAERKRIYVLPEYLEGVTQASELLDYGFSYEISAIEMTTDGYKTLSHRDYLGSLLGLGLERAVIGDIAVYGDGGYKAVAFCDQTIGGYVLEQLLRIANERVKVRRVELDTLEMPERRVAAISDTVASARLDCIVAAICSLSRDKARAAVESGLVELDFEREERADRTVSAPCMLSVRGYGRFEIISVSDKTKKGRYRLLARKYL